jgi:hypothetical protein
VSNFTEIILPANNFGIKYVADACLPTEFINFTDRFAPAQPLPDNRQGENRNPA